jgi:hypothetical protein
MMSSDVLTPSDESRVAVVLMWHNLKNIELLLADVPFKDAHPLHRALMDLSGHQLVTGLLALAQTVLNVHNERQALMSLSTAEQPLN